MSRNAIQHESTTNLARKNLDVLEHHGVPRIHSTIESFALTEILFRDPRLESISRQESLRQAPPPTHTGNSNNNVSLSRLV